ncbi:hypothetical protein [Mycoplasma phocoenae]|uniref:Uncharacterized protein n=1 Tax=Mycoplasma phocoenae TaxID=754517 RepID=A0A858U2Y8_9MOLU|nr:hypothetical protein [Mycoplasma phocoenae]QJG66782.1 hypothetical protein HGG69_00335 [Mycoplasma phocoenae]
MSLLSLTAVSASAAAASVFWVFPNYFKIDDLIKQAQELAKQDKTKAADLQAKIDAAQAEINKLTDQSDKDQYAPAIDELIDVKNAIEKLEAVENAAPAELQTAIEAAQQALTSVDEDTADNQTKAQLQARIDALNLTDEELINKAREILKQAESTHQNGETSSVLPNVKEWIDLLPEGEEKESLKEELQKAKANDLLITTEIFSKSDEIITKEEIQEKLDTALSEINKLKSQKDKDVYSERIKVVKSAIKIIEFTDNLESELNTQNDPLDEWNSIIENQNWDEDFPNNTFFWIGKALYGEEDYQMADENEKLNYDYLSYNDLKDHSKENYINLFTNQYLKAQSLFKQWLKKTSDNLLENLKNKIEKINFETEYNKEWYQLHSQLKEEYYATLAQYYYHFESFKTLEFLKNIPEQVGFNTNNIDDNGFQKIKENIQKSSKYKQILNEWDKGLIIIKMNIKK